MKTEKIMKSVIGVGLDPYTIINSLLIASARENAKLTDEEKAERRERRRQAEEQRIRKALVLKSICPDCKGNLVRGKKDKKNDYKRVWTCKKCGKPHTH
jgi:uncharacterized protein with PIN domain